jgi:alkylated DNA repair protein (DNA oxidative demethylase)
MRRRTTTSAEPGLFDEPTPNQLSQEDLAPVAMILRGFAASPDVDLMAAVREVEALSPFRRMVTRGGFEMSVAMTNCGSVGWTTDRRGYRYSHLGPLTGRAWPRMSDMQLDLASRAAEKIGIKDFVPDCCLINLYEVGAKLSLHQDRNEADFAWPIISVSLGLPAVFLFGGTSRSQRPRRIELLSGDVVVWGGASRLAYHGVEPLRVGEHPLTGTSRINLTFRRAL